MSKKTKFNRQWLDPELHPQFDKWLSDVPDNVYQAYCKVCSKPIELSNMGKRALDSHFLKSTTHKSNFCNLNASVESGFSINKSLLIENLHETTLINQRHVYDAILEAGSIHAIEINKNFLSYARSSHKRYKDDVDEKRRIEEKEENEIKVVREQEKKIKELEKMKKSIRKAAEMEEEAIENELNSLKKKQKKA